MTQTSRISVQMMQKLTALSLTNERGVLYVEGDPALDLRISGIPARFTD